MYIFNEDCNQGSNISKDEEIGDTDPEDHHPLLIFVDTVRWIMMNATVPFGTKNGPDCKHGKIQKQYHQSDILKSYLTLTSLHEQQQPSQNSCSKQGNDKPYINGLRAWLTITHLLKLWLNDLQILPSRKDFCNEIGKNREHYHMRTIITL